MSISNEKELFNGKNCIGCRYIGTEDFAKGKTAIICTSEEEGHKGRVIEIIRNEYVKHAHPVRPAWCQNGIYPKEEEK